MKAFPCQIPLGFEFPVFKMASVSISVLNIDVINLINIIAVIIAVIYLLLLLV